MIDLAVRGILIPECLRSLDQAQNADFGCVASSITHYINLLALIVAVGAFFYLIYGGFLYVSAFGDENKVSQGKKVITNAVIGVALASASALIINLLKQVLKVS